MEVTSGSSSIMFTPAITASSVSAPVLSTSIALVTGRRSPPLEITVFFGAAARDSWGAAAAAKATVEPIHSRLFKGMAESPGGRLYQFPGGAFSTGPFAKTDPPLPTRRCTQFLRTTNTMEAARKELGTAVEG